MKGKGRWYLAGPMSGFPEHNFPLFHAETARLRALGYDIVNPAEINTDAVAPDWAECLKRDIPQLCTCDGVIVLEGWSKSRGASLEVHIARQLGMRLAAAEDIRE